MSLLQHTIASVTLPSPPMADFTRYSSGPAPEWVQFEKTWKRPASPAAATLEERRDLANARTAKLFADVLSRPGKNKEFQKHHNLA